MDEVDKLLAPKSVVFISKKKLPQAFEHPQKVFYAKQWFLFLKSGQVYFPDWLCWLVFSVVFACIISTLYQQLPIRDNTAPQYITQPYNPREFR